MKKLAFSSLAAASLMHLLRKQRDAFGLSVFSDQLETLNDDPYAGGWMIKVKISDDQGLAGLMDHTTYAKQCAGEH